MKKLENKVNKVLETLDEDNKTILDTFIKKYKEDFNDIQTLYSAEVNKSEKLNIEIEALKTNNEKLEKNNKALKVIAEKLMKII